MRYRKKPIVVDAWQWEGQPVNTWPQWVTNSKWQGINDKAQLSVCTLEGVMVANKGDWIIKGVKGEVYPCKPDIFIETYEVV